VSDKSKTKWSERDGKHTSLMIPIHFSGITSKKNKKNKTKKPVLCDSSFIPLLVAKHRKFGVIPLKDYVMVIGKNFVG